MCIFVSDQTSNRAISRKLIKEALGEIQGQKQDEQAHRPTGPRGEVKVES